MSANQLVILTGPTASGKTAVAERLQDLLGGPAHAQLISVDSAMIYRGLDIGTAKPNAAELEQYPHQLIDICDPAESYSAADFVRDADQCVRTAWDRGALPILVGGTMLYLNRFVHGIADLPESDDELRLQLSQELQLQGNEAMHAQLVVLDPIAASKIHPNNAQRVLRALEVIKLSGKPMSALWVDNKGADVVQRLTGRVVQTAILPADRAVLHQRISQRFEEMLAAGFLEEVSRLYARQDLHVDLPSMRAVGYRQALQFLSGEVGREQMQADAVTATRRLAKRQLTWLRQWQDLTVLPEGSPEQQARALQTRLG